MSWGRGKKKMKGERRGREGGREEMGYSCCIEGREGCVTSYVAFLLPLRPPAGSSAPPPPPPPPFFYPVVCNLQDLLFLRQENSGLRQDLTASREESREEIAILKVDI